MMGSIVLQYVDILVSVYYTQTLSNSRSPSRGHPMATSRSTQNAPFGALLCVLGVWYDVGTILQDQPL